MQCSRRKRRIMKDCSEMKKGCGSPANRITTTIRRPRRLRPSRSQRQFAAWPLACRGLFQDRRTLRPISPLYESTTSRGMYSYHLLNCANCHGRCVFARDGSRREERDSIFQRAGSKQVLAHS